MSLLITKGLGRGGTGTGGTGPRVDTGYDETLFLATTSRPISEAYRAEPAADPVNPATMYARVSRTNRPYQRVAAPSNSLYARAQ